jgi:hypothetical protein
MADPTHIQKDEACPVAPLADEAKRLHAAYVAAEERLDVAVSNIVQLEAARVAAFAFRLGLENRATFLRAASAKGALFQLSLLGSVIDDLAGCIPPKPPTTKAVDDWRPDAVGAAIDKANRLLYSVAGYLETSGGIDLEDAIGDFWLARRLDPFDHLREALAFGGEEEARGAAPERAEQ